MSKVVDERVVEMRFDNRQFEQNVSTSVSTLDKLKRSLNLSGASKGLEEVGQAAKNVDMGGLGSAVETVRAKFSALQIMGVTALMNITNSAVNAGKRIVSALTIDPVKTGFQEYETQINAVQTILANTKSKGSTLDDVNKALDELNLYADKTIYNFTEMTRNIGTFTAAGIDLETSVSAIQGIANLAAVSGSTSHQASTAMYQLSQALAAGTVKLMDWNSVVNAGMGGEIFQNALKETSKELGTGAEAAIKANGSFRESLSTGWLTSQVLTETLKKFTTSGANEYVAKYTGLTVEAVEAAIEDAKAKYGEADAIKYASKALAEKSGKNEDEIKSVLDMANTAEDAATKVKTFTQLWDTLKESAQSGWTQTWEIIIGDFEEAKDMLTRVSDTIGAIIGRSADARNNLLQGWKDLGGRDDLLAGFKNIFNGISSIVKPIKEAFSEVFRAITPEDLTKITKGFRELTEKLTLSETSADKLKRAFKGVFSIFDMGRKIILTVANAFAKLLGSSGVSSLGGLFLDAAAAVGDFFTSLNEGFSTGGLAGMFDVVVSKISGVLSGATDKIRDFGGVFETVADGIKKACGKIWGGVKTVFGWIKENVSMGDIFAGLAGGGLFAAGAGLFKAGKGFSDFLGGIPDTLKGLFGKGDSDGGIMGRFKAVLDSAKEALTSFTTGVKITSLISIAIAVGILSASMRTISELDAGQITKSLLAIGGMLAMLSITMKSLTKTLTGFASKGLIKSGISLVLVATAVSILASAMKKISDLSLAELTKGLVAVGTGLLMLTTGLRIISKAKVSLSTSIAILALAASCSILADALKKFGEMPMDQIGRGLLAMGGALAELVIATSVLGKFGGGKSLLGSVAILIIVQSLSKMADGLKKFGSMPWDEIGRGLAGMGGALVEVAAVLTIVGKIAGFSSIFAAGAILIVVQGLADLQDAFADFGGMSWDEIGRGLAGMGGALAEVGAVAGLLGKLAGFSSIFASGAILIVIQGLAELSDVLQEFGWMPWDEIGRGLAGMGGALVEVAGVTGLLGGLVGFSSLFAAGSILLVINGLADLQDAFARFGEMSWDEIGRGLAGMGGALSEVAGIAGLLGALAGLPALLGAGAILLAIQGLGDLADAFKKFGEMTWDQIGIGLAGMGGALVEVAAITGALGALAGLPALLGGGAMLLAVQSLGDLADALKKFGDMSWDEVKTGLAAMGGALGELALGGFLNTLSIIGSLSINIVAESLGVLADSVKKWAGVKVPEGLSLQLGDLGAAVFLWTFSVIGAGALALAAPAVGMLADSVVKWTGVSVPDALPGQLALLAASVLAWTFSTLGAASLLIAAPAVGTLADSVKKWTDVNIPDGLADDIASIAQGVEAFTFAFVGGWSIGAIVEPLANLADSVKKWSGVSVPENLEDGLTSLADGVKAFSWAFLGGWSLGAIVGPLGDLASDVKKWNGVSIPSGLGEDLEVLADGIGAFSWKFLGGWTLGSITGPLGDLASDVKKWNGVKVPDGLGDDLGVLADGVGKFSGITDVSVAADALGKIASSALKLGVVDFVTINTGVASITESIKNLASIDSVSDSLSTFGEKLVDSLITPIKNASKQFESAGTDMASYLKKGLESGQSDVVSSVTIILTKVLDAIDSRKGSFKPAGNSLAKALASGASDKEKTIVNAFTTAISQAVDDIKLKHGAFYDAGAYLAKGFRDGVRDNADLAKDAAVSMAKAALRAAEDALGINSPSKEGYRIGRFYGLGFTNAMDDYGEKVRESSSGMAEYAKVGLSDAIAKIRDNVDADMDVRPTIRPVLDLSDVKTGADAIGELLGKDRSIGTVSGINAVNSMMNRRGQNGTEERVLTAIGKLGKDLNGLSRPSYTINGITYDNGSEVSEAIETLVRAARIERRV